MADKPVVTVACKLTDAIEARLARDYQARLNIDDIAYDDDTLIAQCDGADALIIATPIKMTRGLIDRLPDSVRILATCSVGYEHIDLDAAKDQGLIVTNTPEVLNEAVADLAFLLILGAARRAHEGEQLARSGDWKLLALNEMLGTEVNGKRLGIVGMGRIGQAVARRARGFNMTVHYHNRRELPADQAAGASFHADADDLLAVSDFLSLHCPATPETHHWLNAERIARLPDGAIVVNTARGAVVDDAALIAALKSGKLGGAGLDVFEGEPDIEPAYRDLPNTFLTPHIGSATVETRDGMAGKCADNLDAFFAGKEPPDRLV